LTARPEDFLLSILEKLFDDSVELVKGLPFTIKDFFHALFFFIDKCGFFSYIHLW